MSDREFKTVGFKKTCGSTFHSKSPASAARKVFNEVCGAHKVCNKIIKVVDTEKDKVYKYKVSRVLQNKTVIIAGKPILFKYATNIEAQKKSSSTKSKSK